MTKQYHALAIEQKWQRIWRDQQTYRVDLDAKPTKKFYGFGMFNYPSGGGIHIGHVRNFLLPDVLARHQRQQAVTVYSPVGFDSFGSPTENYALKTGISPRRITDQAIANYRRQYQACGFSFDWSKEIDTSQPEYYKWTQWTFLKLHEQGLAYQKESSQWWCDLCCSVLSDEQVLAGKCWRHDSPEDPPVSQKRFEQWFFKITDYADKLLERTADLDWTDWVKTAQVNYIGRSEGLEINFKLQGLGLDDQVVPVFTTAFETIYGATFVVLAPDHDLVERIADRAENRAELQAYIARTKTKSELERQQAKTKTGARVQGLHAVNPANCKPVSVWLADYVIKDYGTGAIMAVPGADQRDFDFAKKYDLAIVYPTSQTEFVSYKDLLANQAKYTLRSDDELDGLPLKEARERLKAKLVDEDKSASLKTNYNLRDWLISRQRYWGAPIPIIHCPVCGPVPVPETDLPILLPEVKDYQPNPDGRSPLAKVEDWRRVDCPKCQQPAQRETDTMDGYVCSSWYQMRYLDPHNRDQAWDPKRAEAFFPVDFYNGSDHVTAHLIYARFFSHFFYDQGLLPEPEPFKKMYFHAKISAPDGRAFSKSKGIGEDPMDIIEQGYGGDALRIYVCVAAPPDVEINWDHNGVPGAYRFLKRVFHLVQNYLEAKSGDGQQVLGDQLLKSAYKAADRVDRSLARIKLNTAVSALMELLNDFVSLSQKDKGFSDENWQKSLEIMLMLLAPFAPHLAEELWHDLGHQASIHLGHWPEIDDSFLVEDLVSIVVQINGKKIGQVEVGRDASQAEISQTARADQKLRKHLSGEIKKEVYVSNRLINFVI